MIELARFLHGARKGLSPLLVISLLAVSSVALLSVGSAQSVSQSQVNVTSEDTTGAAVTGFYAVLYDSAGSIVGAGYTPVTFMSVAGLSYSLQVDGYGGCSFSGWSDGVTVNPREFTATSGALTFTGVFNCGTTTTTATTTATTASGASQLTVDSQLNGGGAVSGFYTALYQNGNVVATGYTPVQFTVVDGQNYSVYVANSGSRYFQYWLDTGSVDAVRSFSTGSSVTMTAVICSGPPGTCPRPTATAGITVYAHRIPAAYWQPCFAEACSAGSGPGAMMYFALLDSAGNVVQSGYANEQGYTFTGLAPGTTYYVYPDDCDYCHVSLHNVVFQYWGDTNSATRPRAVTAGTVLDAWYSCTNGCAGY